MRNYRPPLGIWRLVAGTLLISISVLAAIIYSGNSGASAHEKRSSSTAELSNTLVSEPFLGEHMDLDSPSDHDKRDSSSDGLPDVIPPTLSKSVPGLATSLVNNLTRSLTAVTTAIIPESVSSNGVPLLTQFEPKSSLESSPLPTADQLGGWVDQLGNVLSAVDPGRVKGDIAAVTSQPATVLDQVQSTAEDLTPLANAVDSSVVATPDVLDNVRGLLKGINSSINHIVQAKAANVGGAPPTDLVGNLKNVLQGGLKDIAAASDGPDDVVCSLIEENLCGVVIAMDNIVHSAAGICSSIAAAVSATELSQSLGPNDPITNPAASPTPDGAGGLLPTDLPSLPAPPDSLPFPLPTNTGADGASVTPFGVGPPGGGVGPEPALTNPVPTGNPGAVPGFPSAPATPFPATGVPAGITGIGGEHSQICSIER